LAIYSDLVFSRAEDFIADGAGTGDTDVDDTCSLLLKTICSEFRKKIKVEK